jgi:Glycosyl hydrolase family 63 C-terminal domain
MEEPGKRDIEAERLADDATRKQNWKRWGPYLSERQWGTVREDYSASGNCWDYFPHDHARSRTYRWGEDGLLGITDREERLCFAAALWNGKDSILKERLFGLTNPEGNHGEDVKEYYFYLDSTPTHSYMKALYKYPQREFPYSQLVEENRRRGKQQPEFELIDTGIFDDNRYFDVIVEYAKEAPDDILVRITIANRGPDTAPIHILPTLWFRNTWSWGREGEGYWEKPTIERVGNNSLHTGHSTLVDFDLIAGDSGFQEFIFTENETNAERLWKCANTSRFVKDAFHEYLVEGRKDAVNPAGVGTKSAAHYFFEIASGKSVTVKLRLSAGAEHAKVSSSQDVLGVGFDATFAARIADADDFYNRRLPTNFTAAEKQVARQAYAGLLWSKQFYHYVVEHWAEGDPSQPAPPRSEQESRNQDWPHLYSRDVMSMPDKWEYPWFAAWDLAFQMIPFSKVDPFFAKEQLGLLLREWYMHPNGQMPAYEFAFSDVNPPVHAWGSWRSYKLTAPRGQRDAVFLERVFQKLLLNFTWWVNQKDVGGRHVFAGGFLGLDNIGAFDRSKPLPGGGQLEQADGTAWMAFYCTTMLAMAFELAKTNPNYEDVASKFFEHFVAIADAMNRFGGAGLWNEEDGFYYDQIAINGQHIPLKIRSMVGIVPLFAVEALEQEDIGRMPGFNKRMNWFLRNRPDLASQVSYMESGEGGQRRLLAIPARNRLERMLRYILDENEFLSPYGIRSISRIHEKQPFVFRSHGEEYRVEYVPGESTTGLFGGNSNWRGPIWFPVNFLIIEALERYHHFYGKDFLIECPTGSGKMMDLAQVAHELSTRLSRIFLPDASGRRPVHGGVDKFSSDPFWKDLVPFYEYFHGENGKGLGASHQTGWTSLITACLEDAAQARLEVSEKPAATPKRPRSAA